MFIVINTSMHAVYAYQKINKCYNETRAPNLI